MLEWAPVEKRHVASAAVRWAMAAPHVLRGHIHQLKADSYRVSGDLEASLVHIVCSKSPHNSSPALPQEAAHILRPDELAFLSKWSHPPSGCARAMSMLISELELRPELQVTQHRGRRTAVTSSGRPTVTLPSLLPPVLRFSWRSRSFNL